MRVSDFIKFYRTGLAGPREAKGGGEGGGHTRTSSHSSSSHSSMLVRCWIGTIIAPPEHISGSVGSVRNTRVASDITGARGGLPSCWQSGHMSSALCTFLNSLIAIFLISISFFCIRFASLAAFSSR